jgi:hypothetical protein
MCRIKHKVKERERDEVGAPDYRRGPKVTKAHKVNKGVASRAAADLASGDKVALKLGCLSDINTATKSLSSTPPFNLRMFLLFDNERGSPKLLYHSHFSTRAYKVFPGLSNVRVVLQTDIEKLETYQSALERKSKLYDSLGAPPTHAYTA